MLLPCSPQVQPGSDFPPTSIRHFSTTERGRSTSTTCRWHSGTEVPHKSNWMLTLNGFWLLSIAHSPWNPNVPGSIPVFALLSYERHRLVHLRSARELLLCAPLTAAKISYIVYCEWKGGILLRCAAAPLIFKLGHSNRISVLFLRRDKSRRASCPANVSYGHPPHVFKMLMMFLILCIVWCLW